MSFGRQTFLHFQQKLKNKTYACVIIYYKAQNSISNIVIVSYVTGETVYSLVISLGNTVPASNFIHNLFFLFQPYAKLCGRLLCVAARFLWP